MITKKFQEYKEQLQKNKTAVFNFNNGYECLEFSNYLNTNRIYHTKTTITLIPLCSAIYTIIQY